VKLLRIAIGLLAVVGVIAIMFAGYFLLLGYVIGGGTDEPTVEETLLSPDGAYRAVRIASTGGGAAGWCNEFVLVDPSSTPKSLPTYLQAQGELVFAANCNTNFTVSWGSSTELLVRYKTMSRVLASLQVRATDKSQKIRIRCEPEASKLE
jgi:hypothetical protein